MRGSDAHTHVLCPVLAPLLALGHLHQTAHPRDAGPPTKSEREPPLSHSRAGVEQAQPAECGALCLFVCTVGRTEREGAAAQASGGCPGRAREKATRHRRRAARVRLANLCISSTLAHPTALQRDTAGNTAKARARARAGIRARAPSAKEYSDGALAAALAWGG